MVSLFVISFLIIYALETHKTTAIVYEYLHGKFAPILIHFSNSFQCQSYGNQHQYASCGIATQMVSKVGDKCFSPTLYSLQALSFYFGCNIDTFF